MKPQKKPSFPAAFLLHLHPVRVPAETLRFRLSFGLGGISVVLLGLLFVSGILQLLTYSPDVTTAYDAVHMMRSGTSLSGWVRNIHYWAANILVLTTVLHCCRVYLTGAVRPGRATNWYLGLLLLLLVLAANFTGYLLPWDQLAYWAVTIFINMLNYIPLIGPDLVVLLHGDTELGQETLALFYGLHTGILPLCFALLLSLHVYQVRKCGGLIQKERDDAVPADMVPSVPNLIVREAAVGGLCVAAVCLLAALVDAPLAEMASPGLTPNPAKAAWFFLGFQELLMHLHPTYAICVFPALLALFLIALPWLKGCRLAPGHWFGGYPGSRVALWAALCGVCCTAALVLLDEGLKATTAIAADSFLRGLLPTILLVLFYAAGFCYLVYRVHISRAHAIMAIFLFSTFSLCMLTIISIWFRGPGMQLTLFS